MMKTRSSHFFTGIYLITNTPAKQLATNYQLSHKMCMARARLGREIAAAILLCCSLVLCIGDDVACHARYTHLHLIHLLLNRT